IMKCTQKNPERRYHDCESLLLDLKRSLVDPDGDFVITGSIGAAAPDNDRTVVMSTEELEQLQKQRYDDDDDEYDDDEYDEDEYDDEDEDDEDEDDYQEERRKKKDVNPDTKKIMRILLIVAGVIVALLVIFLVGN